jgi:hypothetical protein
VLAVLPSCALRDGVGLKPNRLSNCHQLAYGFGGATCHDPMSTDIGCRQSHTTRWQLASARCALASTAYKLTSTICQFTLTRIQLARAGGIVRGRMSVDTGLLRVAIDPVAPDIGPPRIPATRCRQTSPHSEPTSSRCRWVRDDRRREPRDRCSMTHSDRSPTSAATRPTNDGSVRADEAVGYGIVSAAR